MAVVKLYDCHLPRKTGRDASDPSIWQKDHLHPARSNRTTRRLAPTTAGERYLKRCQQILADVDTAEEEASCAQERPSGALRMHGFASIGQQLHATGYRLFPDIARFIPE